MVFPLEDSAISTAEPLWRIAAATSQGYDVRDGPCCLGARVELLLGKAKEERHEGRHGDGDDHRDDAGDDVLCTTGYRNIAIYRGR